MIALKPARTSQLTHVIILLVSFAGLYLTSWYSYLLFHSIAELFSIVVAFSIFIIGWSARRSLQYGYLLFLGIAFLFIAGLDTLHTLAYKGMGVFTGFGTNLPTQLWIATRYLQGFSLLVAPFFLRRKLHPVRVFAGFTVVVAALIFSIFSGYFPACYIEGQGLTPFKIVSEYVICALLLGAMIRLLQNRDQFDQRVLRWLEFSIAVSILSEVAFTHYVSVFGFANLLGHLLKIAAYYGLFQAIVETGFFRPFSLLLRDLRQNEEALRLSQANLEERVEERTCQLEESNANLRAEIIERQRVQAELSEVQRRLLDSKEAERLSLARDLHDGPIQDLLAANFQLHQVRSEMSGESGDRLADIQELVMHVSQTLRTICGELRPTVLAPFGLEKALRSLADHFHHTHPEIRFRMNLQPDGIQLPETTRLALFRICEQALNNTAHHARASQVWVQFSFDETAVSLEVHDDGQGFHPPDSWIQLVREGHLGLAGMSERAEALGGKLSVTSSPTSGTHIYVTIPREKLDEQATNCQDASEAVSEQM